MNVIWYFDFISPFAYLQLGDLLALRSRIEITPRPVVLGALLQHAGQRGPAEIPGKREFTYRTAQWRAERAGLDLRFPPAHPFNPLSTLRLAIACGSSWGAIEMLFAHLWREGLAGDTAEALATPARALGIGDVESAIGAASVREELRANTAEAIAAGVYGVPTLSHDGQLFWGSDATGMFLDYISDPQRFKEGEFARIAALPSAIERAR